MQTQPNRLGSNHRKKLWASATYRYTFIFVCFLQQTTGCLWYVSSHLHPSAPGEQLLSLHLYVLFPMVKICWHCAFHPPWISASKATQNIRIDWKGARSRPYSIVLLDLSLCGRDSLDTMTTCLELEGSKDILARNHGYGLFTATMFAPLYVCLFEHPPLFFGELFVHTKNIECK